MLKVKDSWDKWVEANRLSDELEATMYREYSYLLYIGSLFMNFHPKIIIFSILQTITCITAISILSIIMTVSMAKANSFVAVSQYMNYVSLCVITLGLYYAGITNRKSIIRLLEIMSTDFYDYGPTFENPQTFKWKKDFRRFKIIIVVCLPVYMAFVAFSVMFREWIDVMFGYDFTQEDYIDDIYQKAPIRMWLPFRITNEFQKYAFTLYQMLVAGVIAISLGAGDVMMLFLGQSTALQLRILCVAAANIDERARKMYEKEFNAKPPTDHDEKLKDKRLDYCYNRCIKQLVEHHHIIEDFYHAYYDLAKWPTAIAFLNGSLIIAMSILVAISGSGGAPSTYINASLLLVAEVMSMWLLCETGQQVNNWSERLYMAVYEFNWIEISTSNKKMIMIFKEKIKKPLLMMAGGLTPINRDSFGTIMNTAYSYVNLLRASELKKN